ncbi:hypothetical protein HNR40_006903 [Nonomuraea endophytica]|uniref:Secreted protein n=1 Tax=Nonomuraea endophytica TaxID=714136 RepID=A0A7W8AAU2_9ACTN|nr:hypothetical protein [Nonomuraea endophytica]
MRLGKRVSLGLIVALLAITAATPSNAYASPTPLYPGEIRVNGQARYVESVWAKFSQFGFVCDYQARITIHDAAGVIIDQRWSPRYMQSPPCPYTPDITVPFNQNYRAMRKVCGTFYTNGISRNQECVNMS